MNEERISSRCNNFKSTLHNFSINFPSDIEKIRVKIKKLNLDEYREYLNFNLKANFKFIFKQNASLQIREEEQKVLEHQISLIKENLELDQFDEPLNQLELIIQSNYHISFLKIVINSNIIYILIKAFYILIYSKSIMITKMIFIFTFLSFDEKIKAELIKKTGLSIFVSMINSLPYSDLENLLKLIINIATRKYEKETLVELNLIKKIDQRIDDICSSLSLLYYVLKLCTKLLNTSKILIFSEIIIISIEIILSNIEGNLLTTSLKLLSIASCDFSVIYYLDKMIGINSICKCLNLLSSVNSTKALDQTNLPNEMMKLHHSNKKNQYYCISILVNITSKVQLENVNDILIQSRLFLENEIASIESHKLIELNIILLNNLCEKSTYKLMIFSGIIEKIFEKIPILINLGNPGDSGLIQDIEDLILNLLYFCEKHEIIDQIKKIYNYLLYPQLGTKFVQKIFNMLESLQIKAEESINDDEFAYLIKKLQNILNFK